MKQLHPSFLTGLCLYQGLKSHLLLLEERAVPPHLLGLLRACLVPSIVSLCDPMDCSPPGSSVHGILQARILEWVAMPSSRGFFWARG